MCLCLCMCGCMSPYVYVCVSVSVCVATFLAKVTDTTPSRPPPPFSFSFAHFIPFSLHYFCHFRLAAFLCTALSFTPPSTSLPPLLLVCCAVFPLCVFFFCTPVSQGPLWNELLLKKLQCGSPDSLPYPFFTPLHGCPMGCPFIGLCLSLLPLWILFSEEIAMSLANASLFHVLSPLLCHAHLWL